MHLNDTILCKILNKNPSKISILKWYVKDGIVDTGDSHTSELSRLHVVYQKKNRIFNQTFILKIPSAHPFYRVGINYGLYSREYLVYTNILEEMYKLDGDRLSPRLYYADKDSLMLKDLSQSGYRLEDRTRQLDFNQCALVFSTLAKFHALSVKLNQLSRIPTEMQRGTWFTQLQNPQDIMSMVVDNACDQFLANMDPSITQHFLHLKNNLRLIGIRKIRSDHFPFCVLNHGDCWNGNIMFKFDKYGNSKKVKFVDFQNTFWMSPAYDILYFTLCSMQFEVYENHFDVLLGVYITTLNKLLQYLRCDLYEIENLKNDIKKIRHYGLLVLICVLPEFVSSRKDPLDYRLISTDGKTINFDALNKIYASKLYLEISKKWLLRYIEKGHF